MNQDMYRAIIAVRCKAWQLHTENLQPSLSCISSKHVDFHMSMTMWAIRRDFKFPGAVLQRL
jgi:hypothetical protein